MGENLNTAEIEKYILTEQTMKKGILLVAPQVFERDKCGSIKTIYVCELNIIIFNQIINFNILN